MSWTINEVNDQFVINETTLAVTISGGTTYEIVQSDEGPRGQAAGQDGYWTLTTGLGDDEHIPAGPIEHPATYSKIKAASYSGFASPRTITVRQERFSGPTPVLIASATLNVGPGSGVWTAAIGSPLVILENDMLRLVLPSPADSQATDLSVSLGSTP